jgi:ABC-type glutathione transport system ATPase component
MTEPLLTVEGVSKTFQSAGQDVPALSDVSIDVEPGECHAVIGESGSGKSTLAGLILGLFEPTTGLVRFKGAVVSGRRRPLALKRAIQLIQQNPRSALNPCRTIGQSVRLPLDVHVIGNRSLRDERVAELLTEVGLPANTAHRTPQALSGGERQRVAIARALACEPELLVLDEPTSALDVLVQARVLRLLTRIRQGHGLSYVFITHDLAVVRGVADRVSVFERGRLIETGATQEIFTSPCTAYTRRLLGSIPVVTEEEARFRNRFRASAGPGAEDADP